MLVMVVNVDGGKVRLIETKAVVMGHHCCMLRKGWM
jgi:hypothetical protein